MRPIQVNLENDEALALLAIIQLALRHPEFKTLRTAQWAKALGRELQKGIVENDPTKELLCENGWHQKGMNP